MLTKKAARWLAGVVLFAFVFLGLGSGAVLAAEPVISVGLEAGGESTSAGMAQMLPGEVVTKTFKVSNRGNVAGAFFMAAQNAGLKDFNGDQKAMEESDFLLSLLEVEVSMYQQGQKTDFYKGKIAQAIAGAENRLSGQVFGLGILPPGAELVIETVVRVPSWLDNSHEFLQGKFWWKFFCNGLPVEPPRPEPEEELPEKEGFWKLPGAAHGLPGETIHYMISGFGNDQTQLLKNYTVSDIIPEGLVFSGARLPAFTAGGGVTYNILYTTAGGGMSVLRQGVPAGAPFELTAPQLPQGERITSVSIEFDEVPPGFGVGSAITLDFVIDEHPPEENLVNKVLLSFTDKKGNSTSAKGGGEGVRVGAEENGGKENTGEERTENIYTAEVPRWALQTGWSLLNLVLALLGLVVSVLCLLFAVLFKKRKEPKKRRAKLWYRLAVLAGMLPGGLFLYTQDIFKPMRIADEWTPLMAAICVLQGIFIVVHLTRRFSKKHGKDGIK